MTDQPPFDVTVVGSGSRWRIIAEGELDLSTGSNLREVATVLVAHRAPVVDFDLGRVSFVDSAGWRAVEEAMDLLNDHGAVTSVTAASPAAARLVATLRHLASAP